MSAPNGAGLRILALLGERGELTSRDVSEAFGLTVVQACTLLGYLEGKRKIYRAGQRREPHALRPAIVFRLTRQAGEGPLPAATTDEFIARNPDCYERLPSVAYIPPPCRPAFPGRG